MKDRTKPNTSTSAGDDGNVVELTPDMALQDQVKQKIVNLTHTLGEQKPETVSRKQVVEEPTQNKASSPAGQDISQSTETHTDIEQEVDDAFDAVQSAENGIPGSGASAAAKTADDKLLDDLSELTEMVDNAAQNAEKPDPVAAASPEPPKAGEEKVLVEPSAEIDEAQLALDAADIDAALSHEPEEEEVIELSDVVDPAELDTTEKIQADDDIIELTEIVDPAELETDALSQTDEGIIDLSEIVDPATLKTDDADQQEEILELNDVVEPAELKVPAEAEPASAPADEADELIELSDIIDKSETETAAQAEETEELIQLSDVLGRETDAAVSPDIAAESEDQPADELPELDDDETAINLGLEMEAESTEENDLLTEKELEEAMERLFQKKYAGTLEQLISSAVEKAVGAQFQALKRSMTGNKDTSE